MGRVKEERGERKKRRQEEEGWEKTDTEQIRSAGANPVGHPFSSLVLREQRWNSMLRSCKADRCSSFFRMPSYPLFLIQFWFPRVPSVPCRLLPPLVDVPAVARMVYKDKVVFILGTTGSGKSKLAIALAKSFRGEVVNSDKMQVYDGLGVITNKVTEEESGGVPHHLLGVVHPEADFTASDFRREATRAVESIIGRGGLPIVAGGSNSYIEELVEGAGGEFRSRYDCCFLWVDVELPVLHEFVSSRVDKMVEQGLVKEARAAFRPDGDYSRGIWRSIGVSEMDGYFRSEDSAGNGQVKARMLEAAVDAIKANTCRLACCQLQKIRRFCAMGWDVHRIDATEFFQRRGRGSEEELWEEVVGEPGAAITRSFLASKNQNNELDATANAATF
ncbi:unnamed protein product [Musa acuminata subsp. burmannicoides]